MRVTATSTASSATRSGCMRGRTWTRAPSSVIVCARKATPTSAPADRRSSGRSHAQSTRRGSEPMVSGAGPASDAEPTQQTATTAATAARRTSVLCGAYLFRPCTCLPSSANGGTSSFVRGLRAIDELIDPPRGGRIDPGGPNRGELAAVLREVHLRRGLFGRESLLLQRGHLRDRVAQIR